MWAYYIYIYIERERDREREREKREKEREIFSFMLRSRLSACDVGSRTINVLTPLFDAKPHIKHACKIQAGLRLSSTSPLSRNVRQSQRPPDSKLIPVGAGGGGFPPRVEATLYDAPTRRTPLRGQPPKTTFRVRLILCRNNMHNQRRSGLYWQT